ncbi:MAG: DUF2071 domain-containing protein [Verrucomicrobiota bacterium]
MTILRDLTRGPNRYHDRPGGSGDWPGGGCPDEQTLLAQAPHRPGSAEAIEEMVRRFGEKLFLADWVEFVFLHFEVDPKSLQRVVPFRLDLFEGRALVSLVAFTIRRMRLARGGSMTRWVTRPIADHPFLNLRTYVREGRETGIFFMREWLSNRLSVALGPGTFGLPYCKGDLEYRDSDEEFAGDVAGNEGSLSYDGTKGEESGLARSGTIEEFLLERYTAFAAAGRRRTFFRVWHPPWRVSKTETIRIRNRSLLDGIDDEWTQSIDLISSHTSRGFEDVWMGRPHWVPA